MKIGLPTGREIGQEGSSSVELALAAVVLMGMVLSMFQLFLAFYRYHYISEAAREGSRYAMVRGSTSCTNTPNLTNCNATSAEIQTYVKGLGYPGIDATNAMTVTVSWHTVGATQPATWSSCTSGTCNLPGNLVKVQVQYAYPLALPFFGNKSLSMSSTSQMAIAQ